MPLYSLIIGHWALGRAGRILGLRPLVSERRVRTSDDTPDEWVANIGRGCVKGDTHKNILLNQPILSTSASGMLNLQT